MDPTIHTALIMGSGLAVAFWAMRRGEAYGIAKGRREAEVAHRKEMCDLNIKLLIAKGILPPEQQR